MMESDADKRSLPAREALADGYYRLNLADAVDPDVVERIVSEGMETFRRCSQPVPRGGQKAKANRDDELEQRIVRLSTDQPNRG